MKIFRYIILLFLLSFLCISCQNYSYKKIQKKGYNGLKYGMNKTDVFTVINEFDNNKYINDLSIKDVTLRPFPFGYLGRSSLGEMPKQVLTGFDYVTNDLKLNYYSAEVDDKFNYIYSDILNKTFLWEWHIGEWPIDHLALYFDENDKLYRMEKFIIYFELP